MEKPTQLLRFRLTNKLCRRLLDLFTHTPPERFYFVIGAGIHGKDMTLFYQYIPDGVPYSCDEVDSLTAFYSTIHNPAEWYGTPFTFLDFYNEIQVSRI